ncbi:uncharacterized protein L203_103652 [Cryptococcus depauperatus CBS 7841]|uniref:Uncharacterized protein n=1 Tax=Cryptococcus depauperatus CBS 7841 TaxID=1295531 RepID=A0AAJ8M295_9TREE
MPDIKLKNQPFDLDFHPKEPVVFSSLLTGQVCAWRYDDATGEITSEWSARPSKRTARALSVEQDGDYVWVGGKSGNIFQLSSADGLVAREIAGAHEYV